MRENLFIGIDVGGTKIASGVVDAKGKVLHREKVPTPPRASSREIFECITEIIKDTIKNADLPAHAIKGIGLGIPGIVDTDQSRVLITPNINLTGVDIGRTLSKIFKIRVAAGNDVNVGLLGERWLGAARRADNVVGIFPGTGIGGAIIADGKIYLGAQGAAAELGHMIVDPDGPLCSCGNRGCLEAFAGRWAIERDIRDAVKKGKRSVLLKKTKGKLSAIKSKLLREALESRDPVVTRVVQSAAETLGRSCISIKHIFNPQIIVFGGGVIEACGDFILPIVRKIANADPFFAKFDRCKILESELGDDAVLLGAVALVNDTADLAGQNGRSGYPKVQLEKNGNAKIDQERYAEDIFIRADGKVKERNGDFRAQGSARSHKISRLEIQKICKKNPDILFIGTGRKKCLKLNRDAQDFLSGAGITCQLLPNGLAVEAYQQSKQRKALFLHLTC